MVPDLRWAMGPDFCITEAGQFIAPSLQYLRSAGIIQISAAWDVEVKSPTLHFVAHEIELLLKLPLISPGNRHGSIRRDYGHDLPTFWKTPENTSIRAAVYREGELSWAVARNSGAWPGDNFDDDPSGLLDNALENLSFLIAEGVTSLFASPLDKIQSRLDQLSWSTPLMGCRKELR